MKDPRAGSGDLVPFPALALMICLNSQTDVIRARAADGTAFPLIYKIGALVNLHMATVGLD